MAARCSGYREDRSSCVAIGWGALGSQVVTNLVRSGFGEWTLVDHDRTMPHNLARSAFLREDVGCNKAQAMAVHLGRIVADLPAEWTPRDVLGPASPLNMFGEALDKAGLVLDFSASAAVERQLAPNVKCKARRVTFFLSPTGRHIAMLAEDSDRSMTRFELEGEFFRLLIRTRELCGFYGLGSRRFRYGRACNDLPAVIPQHRVALHAALASSAVHALNAARRVAVWTLTRTWRSGATRPSAAP